MRYLICYHAGFSATTTEIVNKNMNPNISAENNPPQRREAVASFSPEELQVLRQCNIESFYQRCIPFGTFLGLGAYYGVKSGYFRGHVRFGATPKVVVSVIIGYFLGKVSYQQKCAEKLMALPNSKIGEMLRTSKRRNESITMDPGFSAPSIEPVPEALPKQSYLDLDSDRPYMGDYDKPPHDAIPVPPGGPPATTYEELRRKNREEYDRQRNQPYRPPVENDNPPIVRAPPSAPSGPIKPKNKYGDEYEV